MSRSKQEDGKKIIFSFLFDVKKKGFKEITINIKLVGCFLFYEKKELKDFLHLWFRKLEIKDFLAKR